VTILSPARSIRAKLALLIAASVGAAVIVAFGIATYRELIRFAEAKRAEMQATAEILAVSVADAVAAGSRAEARQALHAIGRIPGVKFAEIRDPRGGRFAEAGIGVGLASDGSSGQAESSLLEMLTRGSILVETRIVKAGQTVGRLGLLVDTSELGRRLQQALMAAALSAAAAILIGLVVAARLQRSITRPVGELTATMNRVRLTSDFSARAERHSDDETGQLVDAFNDMLDQIGQRDLALEEHRAGLERTVEQRTRQLATARDAAEAANRAKSDFLATMSHEIRTPMNGMLVMAELLAGAELPARQQRYAETIVRSGQTLLTIINDILDLSKIEAGKLELEQGRVPVATIIDDVLGLFWERAASKTLDLAARIGADVPAMIEGDPVRLSQILSNLVNNALKFTDGGHVIVAVERRTLPRPGYAELIFSVRDTGIGIPAEQVDRIFEAFSQADQSTTRRYGGTGLGLSISQRLVAAMGGRIWVDSRPGEGSTFAFSVPARVLEEAASKLPRWRGAALIAVEGEATQAVLGADLAVAGYAVRTASGNPVEDAADVDLVFAGPGWIERMGPLVAPNRAIVICVAPIGNGDVDRLLSAGLADGLLLQPVSSARLREVLAAAESGTLSSLLATRRDDAATGLPDFSGVKVLVADDSPVNREVVFEALGRLNAQTRTVEDGRQAVEAFQSGDFDIVLMDCSMPGLDGFAATRAIRAWEAERGAARTPIMALTAHVAGAAPGSWRDAGMDDYLSKPFTLRGLADCLARWLPERQAIPGEHAPARPAGLKGAESGATALDPAVLASLRTIAGRDTAMLERVFNLFGVHAPARLSALCDALAAGDVAGVAAEAHALKSPSLNIGALRLAALAAEVEAQARSGELPPDEIPDRLRAELKAVLMAIRPEAAAAPPREAPERVTSPSP
jgi:two-component system sensor histidine kinase BarA